MLTPLPFKSFSLYIKPCPYLTVCGNKFKSTWVEVLSDYISLGNWNKKRSACFWPWHEMPVVLLFSNFLGEIQVDIAEVWCFFLLNSKAWGWNTKNSRSKGLVCQIEATKIWLQRGILNSVNYISSLEIVTKPETFNAVLFCWFAPSPTSLSTQCTFLF